MKKILLLLSLLPTLALQAVEPDTTQFKCGFDELLQTQMQDTQFAAFQKRLDFYIQRYKQQGLFVPDFPKPMQQDMMMFGSSCDTCYGTQSLYLIPLVVHIVHAPEDSVVGTGSNISNEQVKNAIMILNKTYAAYDISDTNAFNTGIQFYLAPVGADSNGIIRYSSHAAINHDRIYQPLLDLTDSFYSANRFLNIFVVEKFFTDGSENTRLKGYATFPHPSISATVVRYDWMSDYNCMGDPVSGQSRGRVLAHEIGHTLGLFHTFEQGCTEDTLGTCETNGDRCCDTPPQKKENFSCSNPYLQSCNVSIPTQPSNCMDGTPDHLGCGGFWFTRNQAERMHATLQLVRKGLINIDSINRWGVRHCGLAMDFRGRQNILCDPDTVTLYGLRYMDSVHYRWTVHNPNSTLVDVSGWNLHQIKFHIAGQDTFDVTLIMTQNGISDTMTRPGYVMLRECVPVADTRARWYFGEYAGLLFTEDGVVPDLGAYNAQTLNVRESCLSLSDSNGNLLFYGGQAGGTPDGFLYDASHQSIRNDLGNMVFVKTKGISAQSLLAVPHPVKTGSFYIFSNTAYQEAKSFANNKAFWGGLYYSELYKDSTDQWVFDHTAVNVEVKNLEGVPVIAHQEDSAILIREYMTAIPKCDNNGYWLVVVADDHPQQGGIYAHNNKLLILSVDTSGITLHDTLSLPNLDNQTSIGVAKFSPDGSKLALLNYLLDFDRLQGKATIRYEFNDKLSFGLTFSNNSKFLYFTDWKDEGAEGYMSIYQLQLDFDDPAKRVEIGKIELPGITQRSNYQLAPDGRIYITNFDDYIEGFPFISVINHPDTAQGLSTLNLTGFEAMTVPLQLSNVGGGAQDGFPNFIDAAQYTKELTTISHSSDGCYTYNFRANACCAVSYKWYFGDGDSATGVTASHYYQAGSYDVTLIADGDTINTSIQVGNLSVQISGADTICPSSPGPTYSMIITQSGNPVWNKYKWKVFNGSITDSTHTTTDVTIEGDVATLVAEVQNEEGCTATDTFYITKFTTLGNNIINNDEYLHIYCSSDTGQFSVQGSVPTGGDSVYYYMWTAWNTAGNKFDGDTKDLQLNAWQHDTLFAFREVMSEGCLDWSDTIMLVPNMRENVINNGADTLIIYDHLTSGMLEITGNETEGTSSVSYQWYYSADSTDWHEVSGQNGLDLEHDTFSGYRWFFRNAYIDDCYKRSNIVKVYPNLWDNVIGDTSVYHYCSDDSIQLNGTYPTGGNEPYTYQWFISDNGSVWNTIAGQTEQNLDIAGAYPPITYLKRRAYSGSDSVESNSVQFIHTIRNNTITPLFNSYASYTDDILYACPNSSNNIQIDGSSPILYSGTPAYQWYIGKDSVNFEPMDGKTTISLTMQAEDSTVFIYREVSVSGCTNISKIIKVIPVFAKNEIQADPCYDGSVLNLTGNYVPAIAIPNQTSFLKFYTLWQRKQGTWTTFQSDSVLIEADSAKAKSATYTDPIDSVGYFKRQNLVSIHLSSMGVWKHCYYHSPEIKVYNPSFLNQIEINQSDVIAGKIPLPEGSYAAVWEKNCNNEDWEEITSFDSEDELGEADNFECCDIRRLLIPLDREGNPLACDTFYSNELMIGGGGYITQQPVSQLVSIGDNAVFSVVHTSTPTFDVQWQKYNTDTEEWEDLETEAGADLVVYAEKCNDGEQFRAVLTNDCRTLYTDIAELIIDYNNTDFFLWLKDIPADTAQEPHHPALHFSMHLLSPDIIPSEWATPVFSQWPHIWSDALYHNGIYIHTIIRNKGTDTSKGGKLFLYAGIDAFHSHWDFSFSNVQQTHLGKNNYDVITGETFGTPINDVGIEIPPIPAGDSVILTYHWTNAPDHLIRTVIRNPTTGTVEYEGRNTITYLARIENCEKEPHDMTYPEVFFPQTTERSVYLNVRNNARIAALHSHFLPMKGPRSLSNALTRRPDQWNMISNNYNSTPYSVEISSDSASHFFGKGEMYVYFDQNLWQAFISGGHTGGGYTIVETGVFRIDSFVPVWWGNLTLAQDSVGYMGYSLHYKPSAIINGTPVPQMFSVNFYQNTEQTGVLFLHTESDADIEPLSIAPIEEKKEYDQADKQHNDRTKDVQIANAPPISTSQNAFIFNLYPNPFGNELTVFTANYEPEATITLRDMNGKELYTFTLPREPNPSGYAVTIPTHNLAEAVYFVHYQSNTTHQVKKAVLVR